MEELTRRVVECSLLLLMAIFGTVGFMLAGGQVSGAWLQLLGIGIGVDIPLVALCGWWQFNGLSFDWRADVVR
jgi:cyanate permease